MVDVLFPRFKSVWLFITHNLTDHVYRVLLVM